MKKIIFWLLCLYLLWQLPEVQYATRACGQAIDSFLDQMKGPTRPNPPMKNLKER